MFLRATRRFKDGKVHYYWSAVENVRVGRRVFQRQALYLGELNDSQGAFEGQKWGLSGGVMRKLMDAMRPLHNCQTPPLLPHHWGLVRRAKLG